MLLFSLLPASWIYTYSRDSETLLKAFLERSLSSDEWQSGKIAQLVKCLHCKHELMSSMTRPHLKKPGMMAHDWNCHAGEADVGGSLGLVNQPALPYMGASGQQEALSQETRLVGLEK